MEEKIFTFWEGNKPSYIDLCMETWKRPYILLNYKNLNDYTDLPIDKIKRFSLPQIADIVRVHVLRDHGGYWLDTDTIMISGNLPKENMIGDPEKRSNTIGLLYTEANTEMYKEWALFQDKIINSKDTPKHWSTMGNDFTNSYVKEHPEISIHQVTEYWPETYMITKDVGRWEKYREFYFKSNFKLENLKYKDLLMLHNSWTPQEYKNLSKEEVLKNNCTLSNILRSVLKEN